MRDLTFLQPYGSLLQSIVIVGSTAYGVQSDRSDLDVVLIARESAFENVCEYLFEKEINDAMAGRRASGIEYTVLAQSQVEELFALSSPFSHAIRHGLVLFDTGYLKAITERPFPTAPPRKYFLTVFFESIATQYLSVLKKTEREARRLECSFDCCRACSSCDGLNSAAILPHLIVKMLYLTLPARGLMPLTKNDAADFAATFYSRDIAAGARKAVSHLRNKKKKIAFQEYRSLRKTAAKLYREILAILGNNQDVRDIVRDAANVTRGNYRLIENAALKKCLA